MGKMGAGELDYSSDIDLICLFDESRFDPDDFLEARPAYIKATRAMAALLNDITGEGYVFRTDLRLRPDPAVTPVCLGMEAAERYYESLGRTWERAAYIKARPCAGDIKAGQRFLTALRPFVWRKHLDFAAIQDAHDMRLAIREHKGTHGPITLPGHNMKLGRGGIREIEFFTQFHQIIAGGRDPALRTKGTLESLTALAKAGWIPQDLADVLAGHYVVLRDVEHRIQMVNDAQTHDLPSNDEGINRIAALCGVNPQEFRRDIRLRMEEVHAATEGFFTKEGQGAGIPTAPSITTTETVPETSEDVPDLDQELVDRWRGYPALRSTRAQEIFATLRPHLARALDRAAQPSEAITAFDHFLSGLPAGVQLFSLFQANPQLIDLLADIVGTAPDLASYLSRNASVFDAVIGGAFFAPWPGQWDLCGKLRQVIEAEEDYERQLDAARRWQKEWHFRIGVHHLRGLISVEEAASQNADLAGAVVATIWPAVQVEFARRHGPCPGRGAMVLGMGSLGARRLNARSDLDLIVIYDADGQESSEGKRPLASRAYYARLTQALVTALSAPTAEGRLYEVDMRLRPSGNQGPVATSLQAFRDYQENQAWTWEHMALTRARPVAGPKDLAEDVEQVRRAVLSAPRDRAALRADLAEMRVRIAAAKPPRNPWESKVGRGRTQEIELLSQAAALAIGDPLADLDRGLAAAADVGWLDYAGARDLTAAWRLMWTIGQIGKLLSEKAIEPETLGQGGCSLLLRDTGAPDIAALTAQVDQTVSHAGDLVDQAVTIG
jgi:glutamate-ammonia-ligase adenylyltransferase